MAVGSDFALAVSTTSKMLEGSAVVNNFVYREKRSTCLTPCSYQLALRSHLNTLILSRFNVLQRPLEVLPRAIQPTHVLRRIKIALNQFDQAIDVFSRDSVVFLVEVVDVAVEDLDEELDAHGRVHASIGDAEGALETFEHALAVAVGLVRC